MVNDNIICYCYANLYYWYTKERIIRLRLSFSFFPAIKRNIKWLVYKTHLIYIHLMFNSLSYFIYGNFSLSNRYRRYSLFRL